VDSLDRISREELIDAFSLILEIIRAGIIIVTIGDGMIYDRSDREKAMFQLLISLVVLARSSNESDVKSERGLKNWVMKREEARAKGTPLTRMTPAWITYDEGRKCFVLNEHAATVQRIFELAALGHGTTLIVQAMIKENRQPMAKNRRKDGGKWSRRYLTLILENRAVLGDFAPGQKNHGTDDRRALTGELIKNYFPPVSDNIHDLWSKVAAAQQARKGLALNRVHPKAGYTNLFSGMCRCASCGTALTINRRVTRKGQTYAYLRCPERYETKTCMGGQTYRYEPIETAILDHLSLFVFDKADYEKEASGTLIEEIAKAKAKVIDLQSRIENLLDEAEIEGMRALSERIAKRKAELQEAQEAVAALEEQEVSSRHALTPEQYIAVITAKRTEANSDDPEIRSAARAGIRLSLQKLIRRINGNSDGSITAIFNVTGYSYCMDISKEGKTTISLPGAATIKWRNPPGGAETAKRLVVQKGKAEGSVV